MSTHKKTHSSQSVVKGIDRIEKLHPHKTFMFFGLVGSTILFLSMAFLYFVTISRAGAPEGFQLPKVFSVSTIVLIVSSSFISGAAKAFRDDSFNRLKIALTGTFILGTLFCVLQIYGWMKMAQAGFFIQSNVGVAYLYVITGMHFIHVIGGLLYILSLTIIVFTRSNNIASSLMFLTDQNQHTRLQLASVFWHYVDALWVTLFFMFLFSF